MAEPFSVRGAVDLSELNRPVAPPPGAPGGAPVAGGYVIEVSAANFQSVIEGSTKYPVVVLLWLPTDAANAELARVLDSLATEFAGGFQLARVDAQAHPQIAAAFGVEGVPMVVAVIQGQPLPLFAGAASMEQARGVLSQVLATAQQAGLTGKAPSMGEGTTDDDVTPAPDPEPELPPLHQAAFDAIDAGNYPEAIAAYEKALKQDPSDSMARAGLAQTHLMARASKLNPAAVVARAHGASTDLDAALDLADLDLIGGATASALDRLTGLLPAADAETKERLRARLVEYFEVIGPTDPLVMKARQKLALYLY